MGSLGDTPDHPAYIEAHVPYVANPRKEYTAGTLDQYRWPYLRPLRQVHDIRHHHPEDIGLDKTGFQLISIAAADTDNFDDAEWVKSTIYPATEAAMRAATGASRVHCFSHLVRRQKLADVKELVEDGTLSGDQLTGITPPSPAAHIDHSAEGSLEVLRDNLEDGEGDVVVKGGRRWGIVNLWRPIKKVQRDPLCVCDARSVERGDLVLQRVYLPKQSSFGSVSRGSSFGTIGVRHNPKHEWYHCSNMTPEEALLIKIHDSAAPGKEGGNGTAGGVPHTALQVPGTEDLPARESCELRCLVFWD